MISVLVLKFPMSSSLNSPIQVDVAVFIALREEFDWFREIFGGPATPIRDGSHFFYRMQYADNQGVPYELVLVLGGTMGGTAATVTTSHLLQKFKPRTIVNIGLAGGLKDVCLGDVVTPSQVNSYLENSKAVPAPNDTFHFQLAGEVYRCAFSLVNLIQNFPIAYPSSYDAWKRACTGDLIDIFGANDLAEFEANDAKAADIQGRNVRFRRHPIVTVGHLASGPMVAAAESFTAWLKKNSDRTYLCVEMEAGGMLAATFANEEHLDSFVIRGVSDFSDEEKGSLERTSKDRFRRYAMRNATRLLGSLLENGLISRWKDDPAPSPQVIQNGSQVSEPSKSAESTDVRPALPTHISAIKNSGVNPLYEEDLRELQANTFSPDAIINRRSVVVAVGREWVQDLVDRPVAAWIRDAVEEYFALHRPDLFRRGLVLGDLSADTVAVGRAGGLISVGGPRVNRVTLRITSSGQVRQLQGGGSMCFMKDVIPQVALWGSGPGGTRSAVRDYIWHQDGLSEFMRMCLPEDITATISQPKDGQEVGRSPKVEGVVQNLPSELRLWIASVPEDGNLHPHGSELKLLSDRWFETAHLGGEKLATPSKFRLKLIAVSEPTSRIIAAYLAEASSGRKWVGVGGIPHRVLAAVTVRRSS